MDNFLSKIKGGIGTLTCFKLSKFHFILFSFKKLCYTGSSVQDRKVSCLFVERRWKSLKSFSVRDNKGSYFLTFIGINGFSTIRMCGC